MSLLFPSKVALVLPLKPLLVMSTSQYLSANILTFVDMTKNKKEILQIWLS